jgi:hypothetical protein
MLAIGTLLLGRATRRAQDLLRHHGLERLARLGSPAEVLEQLEEELADPATLALGRVRLTADHLVILDRLGVRIWRLDELVWVYPRETRQVLQLLPLQRFHLCLVTRQEEMAAVRLEIDQLQRVLDALGERAPALRVGYEEELARMWETAPARLLAHLDERRAQQAG